jgi:hypothetical protein
MVDSRQEGPSEQHNHGPGTFIGGDNYGPISHEMLDPQTKSMLAKLPKDAPELALLLRKALRDGIISPDVAEALMLAVRNINEDVADALLVAGQNINEDVAVDLRIAGQNINEEVANKFVRVKEELSDTAHELKSFLNSLRKTVGQLSSPQGRSNLDYQFEPVSTVTGTDWHTGGVITRPSTRSPDKWWFRFRLICCSFGVGVIAGATLMHYHLVAYVTLAGVLGFAALVIPRIASARRGARASVVRSMPAHHLPDK